jgi:hypothetical protein
MPQPKRCGCRCSSLEAVWSLVEPCYTVKQPPLRLRDAQPEQQSLPRLFARDLNASLTSQAPKVQARTIGSVRVLRIEFHAQH